MTVVWTALLSALALVSSLVLGVLSTLLDDPSRDLLHLAQLAALYSLALALLSLRERS